MNVLDQPIVKGLPDLCSEAFVFAIKLRDARDPGLIDDLRNAIENVFASLNRRALSHGIEERDIELARYAIAALIDEIVLSSNWAIRNDWASLPLQLHYFDEMNAGGVFYDKLESLRGSSSKSKLDVLEVYATCLGLGFRGKYGDMSGATTVRTLMAKVAAEIAEGRGEDAKALSPNWQPTGQIPEKIKNMPAWIVVAACGGVVLILFVVLDWLLRSRMAETFSGS